MLTWFVQSTWFPWIAVAIAYMLVTFLLGVVVNDFFGGKAGRLVFLVFWFPLVGFAWLLNRLFMALSWPWRYRSRRLMRETFGSGFSDPDPYDVNRKLASLAKDLDKAFSSQEIARSHAHRHRECGRTRAVREEEILVSTCAG